MESPIASSSRAIPQPFPSATTRKREEDLVYLFEAEEERITNLLSRKLERLKEEKIELENLLEAENESHVNRLTKEISNLRALRDQQQASDEPSTSTASAGKRPATNGNTNGTPIHLPPANVMLEAMRRENEELRSRLVESERGYIRLTRMNDIYREELIELRRRLGLPIDNLIGLPSTSSDREVYSQPTHLRSQSSMVRASVSDDMSSPSSAGPSAPSRPQLGGLPIPISRAASSQTAYRVSHQQSHSSSTTPNTTSPSSSLASPFPFSPTTNVPSGHPPTSTSSSTGSFAASEISPSLNLGPSSYLTELTTPPSSTSPLLHIGDAGVTYTPQLSYPSVPPPSLSSSLGSPVYSRRNSFSQANRRMSMDRGSARVAETGSLRNRRASVVSGGMALDPEIVAESPPEASAPPIIRPEET